MAGRPDIRDNPIRSGSPPVSENPPTYRLFRMNALTGAPRHVEEFTAWSDDEAIGRALEAAGEDRIELWRDGAKLAAISGRNGPVELRISHAA
jgi:hypothetical protein